MNEKKEQTNHIRKKAIKVLKKLMKPKVLIVIAICIGIASISWGVKEEFFQDGQTEIGRASCRERVFRAV